MEGIYTPHTELVWNSDEPWCDGVLVVEGHTYEVDLLGPMTEDDGSPLTEDNDESEDGVITIFLPTWNIGAAAAALRERFNLTKVRFA